MKQKFNNIKSQMSLECLYSRILVDKNNQVTTVIYMTKSNPIYDINEFIKAHFI